MQQNINQTNQYEDEIDLIEIIQKLIKSKMIIIVTTLIITILTYLYTLQQQPTYQSSVLIEIGHYNSNDGSIKLLEQPSSLIQDLKINLIHKNLDENLSSAKIKIKILEDELITIDYSSGSAEKNTNVLNKFINYLDIRHSRLANAKSLELSDEIDSLSSEIEYTEKLLLALNKDKKLQISSQINTLTNQLPIIDRKISDLEQIITEEQENLQLLKSVPDLYMERTTINPTLNQVIYTYKINHTDLLINKQNIKDQIYNLEKKLEIMENSHLSHLESEELFKYQKEIDKLKVKLKGLENLNFTQTKTIGGVKTHSLDPNNKKIMVLGFIAGLFAGILIVFINEFVKTYRERKA
jgi:capsular polysaccharide biosynthesis protein